MKPILPRPECHCLRCLLSQACPPSAPISAVLASGRLVQSASPSWLLSRIPSFASWQYAPLVSGDLTRATYVNHGEGEVRQIQIQLPKGKLYPIPPLQCRYEAKPDHHAGSPGILPF